VGVLLLGRLGGVAGDQALHLAAGGGHDLHALADAAGQQLLRDLVAAQEGGRGGIGGAHALEQRIGGVGGAGEVAAREARIEGGQFGQLLVQRLQRDGFGDDGLRQVGGVRGHRRDAEGGDGEAAQDTDHRAGQGAGVFGREGFGASEGALHALPFVSPIHHAPKTFFLEPENPVRRHAGSAWPGRAVCWIHRPVKRRTPGGVH